MAGTAPVLIPRASMTPAPRVDIAFPVVAAGTQRATVYCITADRTRRVRGAIDVYAAGGFAVIDTEPPFGSPVAPVLTYRAEFFNAAGVSLGYSDSAATQIVFAGTVIHQPVAPDRAALVFAERRMAQAVERPFEGELVRPLGRSVPVYIGHGRSGVTDVDLTCVTMTGPQAAAFEAVFGGYEDVQLPVVCIRSSLPLGLPQPFFAVIENAKRVPTNARAGGTRVTWEMTGTEAAAPVEAISLALLTYADVEAAFPTYAALEAAYLTYFDVESDFSLAGST